MRRALSLVLSFALTALPAVQAAAHGSHGTFRRPPPLPESSVPVSPAAEMPIGPGRTAASASPADDVSAQLELPFAEPAAPAAAGAEAASAEAHGHDHDHAQEGDDAHAGDDEHARARDAAAAAALFDGQGRRGGVVDFLWSAVRYPAVVRGVDELLNRSLPAERRAAAARALARLNRPETAAALRAASRDAQPQVAQAARDALAVVSPAAARVELRSSYRPPADDFESARRPVHFAALKRVVAVATVFTAIEAVGSWLTGSVSLQADAMHLTADLMINVGTLYAAAVAQRPPNPRNTYGGLKLEPFIGLVSAVAIAGMGGFAAYEAVGRLLHPASVPAVQTMLLALSGLTSNALSTAILYRFRGDSLSLKGAFIHAATDALGSVGIIVAGGLILAFGWLWADPLITFAIVALIARTTWELGRSSWSVLMDAVPEDVDLGEIERELLKTTGAAAVVDLHVWSVNSMERAATVRLRLPPGIAYERALKAAKAVFERWNVKHSTVELSAS